ncbi:unnamed protein product [Clonostachys rosea]|uniref:Uncharacterized protein n=1 Tax=Bionectria ochroleuca TaxID=29856 RepID=A0ABY6V5D2_BIOOC|nr:unnamed protein product [Clonostachys rosea]
MPEGRQSPPPERQSGQQVGSQTKNAPESDPKSKDWSAKEKQLHDEIDKLESNPKGPMEDALESKFSKETGNPIGKNLI